MGSGRGWEAGVEGGAGFWRGWRGIKRKEGTKCKSCESHENSSTKMESCFSPLLTVASVAPVAQSLGQWRPFYSPDVKFVQLFGTSVKA